MKLDIFFNQHKIFTLKEITSFLTKNNVQPHHSTLHNLLTYHQDQKHILRVRRGLYYTVPSGVSPKQCPIDSFLITGKMADDAILGYKTALDLFGKLHAIQNEFIYISKNREEPYHFRDIVYRSVSIPSALKNSHHEDFGVTSIDRLGQKIKVTTLERTLVDVLDRPYLCGSWEDIWLSLESIEYLDVELVIKYALLLAKRTTIAKLGFFLEVHRDQLMISDEYLNKLLQHRPNKPFYFERSKSPQKLLNKWNIIVPLSLINREWEEPNENI